MPYVLLGFPLLSIIVLGAYKIRRQARRYRRSHVMEQLIAASCRTCGQTYGPRLRDHLIIAEYLWHPAPGHTVSSLQLPSETYYVKCPHCGDEVEFNTGGKPFQHPQTGVIGFTRSGILRSPESTKTIFPL